MQLTREQARRLLLAAQDLLEPPPLHPTKENVLETIRRMGVLQIDTIHVVARSPYLVLHSRLGDYDPVWVEELLSDGKLFEYWSHEACFLPMEDWPLYRRLMLDGVKGWAPSQDWIAQQQPAIDQVLAYIRAAGSARSADFERTDGRKSGGWWDRKPEKKALEYLFNRGDLMITGRVNFHRVYSLRKQVLPGWDDTQAPAYEQVIETLLLRTAKSLGVAVAGWFADYYRLPKTGMAANLERLVAEGKLVKASIEGWEAPAYIHPDNLPLAQAAQNGLLNPTHTTFLSPFDPLVWHRPRAAELFDFNYTIECYTPAPKRQYGYFTLPILWQGKLIGRLDPKAHRREKIFEVKSFYLEPGIEPTPQMVEEVGTALHRFATWHKTPQVVVQMAYLPGLADALTTAANAKAYH